jgi:kynurenine formamidase
MKRPFTRTVVLALVVGVLAGSAVALAMAGGARSASGPASPVAKQGTAAHTITWTKVVDLQHVITQKIPLWPGDPHVRFVPVATMAKDGYFLRKFTIGEHSATHMNAPNSFIAGNHQAITSYSATQRVVPAAVIDVRAKCAADSDYRLTVADVQAWEAQHGQLQPGTFVIMFTGWQDRWNDPKAFFSLDAKGRLHFPGFSRAATMWLVDQRQIAGVGIDTHGVDPGLDTSYATNTEMAKTHKIAIECLAHLDRLPATGATLVLGPLALKNGSGSPLSVMALIP